ncbi:MAG: M48 family metalloprotease [Fibrobacter sp.]|jgi:predicted Zn-dependent protease|nr:M48 family metalloprotease [Fibrobacter sp.]
MKNLTKKYLIILLPVFLFCDTVRPFLISEEQEISIGNNLKNQISADSENYPPFKGDYRVTRFVDSIGAILAQNQKERPNLRFTFTILEDDSSINAFAIPGGHVFVYTGLLKEVENTAELAGVLAHEIGHITRYHGADRLVAGEVTGLVNQILFGDESTIAKAAASLLENLAFLKFSRNNEFEADSSAVVYTSRSGINPLGVRDFFLKLKRKYGDSQKIFEPLSTHPLLSERIENVEKIINRTPGIVSDSASFYSEKYLHIKSLLQ